MTNPTAHLRIHTDQADKGLAVLAARNHRQPVGVWAARWIRHGATRELDSRPTLEEWLDAQDTAGNLYAIHTRFPACIIDHTGDILQELDPIPSDRREKITRAAVEFLKNIE